MDNRYKRLKKSLDEANIDALVLTKTANQRYLEGFTGSDCFMLVGGAKNFIVADSRYTEMAEHECRTAAVRPHRMPHPPFGEVLASAAREAGFARVGFEAGSILWEQHRDMASAMEAVGVEFVPTESLVEKIRAKKEPEEAAMLGAACQIADRALRDLLLRVRPGVSEMDLKIELEYRLRTGGAEAVSFDTMVLFGARSSQPHAVSRGDVYLKKGDFILIDYGAKKGGYCSDTTRTFVCGSASDEQRAAYDAVLKAQVEALAMIAPGGNGRDINQRALDVITGAGWPGYGYGIGHGVGLEIHEQPFLRQQTDCILEPDMTVTVEPGTYKPGWGGIRIEDTVLVTERGHEVLTSFPKELIEL